MAAAVRSNTEYIEIDQTKGRYPYMRLGVLSDDRKVWNLIVDRNEGGQVVGEGVGIAGITISQKKLRKLRDFLCEQDLGDF